MIALAAALLLAGPGDTASRARAVQDPTQRRVCRVQETLGSITPRRLCRTAGEWAQIDAAMDRASQRATQNRNDHSGSGWSNDVRN